MEWDNLLSGLAGALIGAVGGIGGSVWVNRRELIRQARLRLFEDLLPAVMALMEKGWFPDASQIDTVVRASYSAGRGVRKLAVGLRTDGNDLRETIAAADRNRALNQFTGVYEVPPEIQKPHDEARQRLLTRLENLDQMLQRKVL